MRLESYGRLCTQVYDLTKPGPPPEAFNFYLKQAKCAGGLVLEPMCGSGRFLIPLLEQGVNIEGSDASADMLEACRVKCESRGLKTNLYQQFIEETDLPKKYRLIIIPASSFILVINKQAARNSLKKMYEHLHIGGKLILEIDTPKAVDSRLSQWIGFWVDRLDGARIIFSSLASYDETEMVERAIHKYELFNNGCLLETELENFAMRFYEKDVFKAMLEDAGFVNIRAIKPYQDTEPVETVHTIVFSAEKSEKR